MDPNIIALTREEPRYAYEAFEFVCQAVTHTQERLGLKAVVSGPAAKVDDDRHVSGEELLRGACDLALRDFGLMAPAVFRQWGIQRTDDLGEIVFRLIKAEKLSQSERDDPNDFHEVFDLAKELEQGFAFDTSTYSARKIDR